MAIEHLQKVCDVYDWADDRIDGILRHRLCLEPNFQRKSWEFAMIYLALELNGKLDPKSQGLAFGAGRERLIYALANRVNYLLVTDLYETHSKWVGARIDDPKKYLLAHAPFPVDDDVLDARYMDMTKIDYGGPPLDFCYSSCSFEHIGTDDNHFVQHLQGAHRILKDDGIYVMTTELRYGDTIRRPHNFFFSLYHLIDIVTRSDFRMDSVFDARLRCCTLNAPNINAVEYGVNAARMWQPVVTPSREGNIFTSALLILRKGGNKSRPTVIGYEESRAWVNAQWQRMTEQMWVSWQCISPTALVSPAVGHEEFAEESGRNCDFLHSAWIHFGGGRMIIRIVPPARASGENGTGATVRLVSKPISEPMKRALVARTSGTNLPAREVRLEFEAEPERVYAVIGHGPKQPAEDWAIFAKRRYPKGGISIYEADAQESGRSVASPWRRGWSSLRRAAKRIAPF